MSPISWLWPRPRTHPQTNHPAPTARPHPCSHRECPTTRRRNELFPYYTSSSSSSSASARASDSFTPPSPAAPSAPRTPPPTEVFLVCPFCGLSLPEALHLSAKTCADCSLQWAEMSDAEKGIHTFPPLLERQELEAEYEHEDARGVLSELEREAVERMGVLERVKRVNLSKAERRELIGLRLVMGERTVGR